MGYRSQTVEGFARKTVQGSTHNPGWASLNCAHVPLDDRRGTGLFARPIVSLRCTSMFTATCSPERWPTPLAIVYSDLLHGMAGTDSIPYADLRRFLTQLLQILVGYALLEAGRLALPEKVFLHSLSELAKPSDGKMNDVFHELAGHVARASTGSEQALFFAPMWAWWRTETLDGRSVHAAIRKLVTIRNNQSHETAPADSVSSHEQVALLTALLPSLRWLESYRILRLDHVRLTQQGPTGALTLFVGDNPRGDSRPNAQWQGSIHQEHLWITNLQQQTALSAFPFFWSGKRGSGPTDTLFTVSSVARGQVELSQPLQAGLRHVLPEAAARSEGVSWIDAALRQSTSIGFHLHTPGGAEATPSGDSVQPLNPASPERLVPRGGPSNLSGTLPPDNVTTLAGRSTADPGPETDAGSPAAAAGGSLAAKSQRQPPIRAALLAAVLLCGLSAAAWLVLRGAGSTNDETDPDGSHIEVARPPQPVTGAQTSSERGCTATQSWQGDVCVAHIDAGEAAAASYRWSRERFGAADATYRYDDIYAPTLDYWYRSRSYARDRLPENFRSVSAANGYHVDDLTLLHTASDGQLFFESGHTRTDRGPFFHAKLVWMRHDGERWRIAGEATMSRFPDAWQPLVAEGGPTLSASCGVFWNTTNPGAGEWTLVPGIHGSTSRVRQVVDELGTCFGLEMRGNRAGTLHTWRLATPGELQELLDDVPPTAAALPPVLEGAVAPSALPPETPFWVESDGQPVVVTRSVSGELRPVSGNAEARIYAIRVRREP